MASWRGRSFVFACEEPRAVERVGWALSGRVMQHAKRNGDVAIRRIPDRGRLADPPELAGKHRDLPIHRGALVRWFADQTDPVVAMFAPAGYGKTTLLRQVEESDPRLFAGLSLGAGDNEPVMLVRHLAQALARLPTSGRPVAESLRFPAGAPWSEIVPRLLRAFGSIDPPAVLVLDDVHLLHNAECLDVVAALCASVPRGSQVVLAGREEPELGLGRLRANHQLAELGREQLALAPVEAKALLLAFGADITGPEVAELTRRTEGWVVGLCLTELPQRMRGCLNRTATSAVVSQDGHVADYVRSEVLSRLREEQIEFMTRTAVLDRMCGPLCDAVLEQAGECGDCSNRWRDPTTSSCDSTRVRSGIGTTTCSKSCWRWSSSAGSPVPSRR